MKFFLPVENDKRRDDLMNFEQCDRENLHDVWSRFKKMVKACPHYALQNVSQFGLTNDTQQSVDTLFLGGMLRSSYNQIKTTLNSMANNDLVWKDNGFGSRQGGRRSNNGMERNTMVVLQGQVTKMNKILQPMALSQVNDTNSSIQLTKRDDEMGCMGYGSSKTTIACPLNIETVAYVKNDP